MGGISQSLFYLHLNQTNQQRDNAEQQKETDRQLKELGKQIGGLGANFGSFTEGLAPIQKAIAL